MEVGQSIYYTGDMANASWWGKVTAIDQPFDGAVKLEHEIDDGERMTETIIEYWQIGTVYHGHCNPRFVTGEAHAAWKTERMGTLAASIAAITPKPVEVGATHIDGVTSRDEPHWIESARIRNAAKIERTNEGNA